MICSIKCGKDRRAVIIPVNFIASFTSVPEAVRLLVPGCVNEHTTVLRSCLCGAGKLGNGCSHRETSRVFLRTLGILRIGFFAESLVCSKMEVKN